MTEPGLLTIDPLGYVWKTKPRSRKVLEGGGQGLSASRLKAAHQAMVRKAPEVMVKVTEWKKGQAKLEGHFSYLTRNGKLAIETDEGIEVVGKDEIRDLAEDWAVADERKRVDQNIAASIVLSMPAGTDPARLRAAAREFAVEQFGGKFQYAMVFHHTTVGDKSKHPHVHLVVKARGEQEQVLRIDRRELASMRVLFAEKLRARGVDAAASSQLARGKQRRNLKRQEYFARHPVKRGRPAQQPRRLQEYVNRLTAEVVQSKGSEPRPAQKTVELSTQWKNALCKLAEAAKAKGDLAYAEDLKQLGNRAQLFVTVADELKSWIGAEWRARQNAQQQNQVKPSSDREIDHEPER